MKPLYLAPGQTLHVRLDGPALLVEGGGRCAGRYPLGRVSRVVSATDVTWQTPALLACLSHGIHVAFLDAGGRTAGHCFGPRRREATLAARLAEFLDRPDWRDDYAIWLCARERREILRVLRQLHIHALDLRPEQARSLLFNRLVRQGWRDRPGAAHRMLAGDLEAFLAAELERVLGEPELVLHHREGFNLLRDMGQLLSWRLFEILFALAKDGGTSQTRALTMAFEAEAVTWKHACAEHIYSLEQWLREQRS